MQNIAGHCQQTIAFKSLLTTSSNVLPLHLSRPLFEFSLKVKVMGSNPGCLLKSFLLYLNLHKYNFPCNSIPLTILHPYLVFVGFQYVLNLVPSYLGCQRSKIFSFKRTLIHNPFSIHRIFRTSPFFWQLRIKIGINKDTKNMGIDHDRNLPNSSVNYLPKSKQ